MAKIARDGELGTHSGVGSLPYPSTRRVNASRSLGSLSFPDPYQWLEAENEEVEAWQQEQAALASSFAQAWPHYDRLKADVARFLTDRRVSLPRFMNGYWFRTEIAEKTGQARAIVAREPFGEGRVLFDPADENPEKPPFLSWISPSPNGLLLAVGVCADGSENNRIKLIDVVTGEQLDNAPPQMLMDNWTGGAQWLPDSSGFFFSAILGKPTDFQQAVFLHRLAAPPPEHPLDIGWMAGTQYRMVVVSRDGRHAIAIERLDDPVPVAFTRLDTGKLEWIPFINHVDGCVAGHVIGDQYVAVTDVGAPRGRLVAIDLACPTPNDPTCWRELIPETEAVLRTVTPVSDRLYLTEYVDTYARVRIVRADGTHVGSVALSGKGAIGEALPPFGNLMPRGHPDRFIFAFSSLTSSWGYFCHEPDDDSIVVLREPIAQLDDTVVEDFWAVSADGTRIPYHVVRPRKLRPGPQPTLIYAYGAYNAPLMPQFPGAMAAFVAAGGAFVHAHLRGGGEFGREWWENGRYRNKQNTYDDLYAVAEDLIARNRSAPRLLAVTGASSGGLTAGVAAVQRPDLWGAVIPRVPRLDLIGACETPYGRLATLEDRVTDLDDPDEIRRLASFSPYHLVREGVAYPAIYLDAGATDPRCPPQDARKFAASVQNATSGDAPVLLHVWSNVGHGWATGRQVAIEEYTEWLAFTWRALCGDQPARGNRRSA